MSLFFETLLVCITIPSSVLLVLGFAFKRITERRL